MEAVLFLNSALRTPCLPVGRTTERPPVQSKAMHVRLIGLDTLSAVNPTRFSCMRCMVNMLNDIAVTLGVDT